VGLGFAREVAGPDRADPAPAVAPGGDEAAGPAAVAEEAGILDDGGGNTLRRDEAFADVDGGGVEAEIEGLGLVEGEAATFEVRDGGGGGRGVEGAAAEVEEGFEADFAPFGSFLEGPFLGRGVGLDEGAAGEGGQLLGGLAPFLVGEGGAGAVGDVGGPADEGDLGAAVDEEAVGAGPVGDDLLGLGGAGEGTRNGGVGGDPAAVAGLPAEIEEVLGEAIVEGGVDFAVHPVLEFQGGWPFVVQGGALHC